MITKAISHELKNYDDVNHEHKHIVTEKYKHCDRKNINTL